MSNSTSDHGWFSVDRHDGPGEIRHLLEHRPPHHGPHDLKAIIGTHLATTRRVLALLPTEDPP